MLNNVVPLLPYEVYEFLWGSAIKKRNGEWEKMLLKYRKKPVVIEAIQFNGLEDYLEICEWINKNDNTLSADEMVEFRTPIMLINTLEGTMAANKGDYIIKGVNGEFYPCKPDIFEKTYEIVGGLE